MRRSSRRGCCARRTALRDALDATSRSGTSSPRWNRRARSCPASTTGCSFRRRSRRDCKSLGADWDRLRVDYALRQHEQWYKGDGAYGDGPEFHWDYYNSFVIHPMLIDVLDACGDESPAWKDIAVRAQARATRYAAVQERLIAPDGSFPPIGRSIAYRCGAFHLLAQAALRRRCPTGCRPRRSAAR